MTCWEEIRCFNLHESPNPMGQLGVVITTDTWVQLVSTTLNHKTCINTSRQVLEKTLFAINAVFTQDNNLSKPKVEGSENKRYMFKT